MTLIPRERAQEPPQSGLGEEVLGRRVRWGQAPPQCGPAQVP